MNLEYYNTLRTDEADLRF